MCNIQTKSIKRDDFNTLRIKRQEEIINSIDRVAHSIQLEKDQSIRNKPLEDKKFQEFIEIAKNRQYFNLAHVDALKLPYHFLIFLTKKNTGKSRAIYSRMWEAIKEGKKFIFMRTMATEITESGHHFRQDSFCPVFMIKCGKSAFLYKKSDWEEVVALEQSKKDTPIKINPSISKLRKYGFEEVGEAIDFKFCQSIGGGNFENYAYIFYDECLSYCPNKQIRDSHLQNWAAFISSIARNKESLTVYMFGNMRPNSELLDFYGIHVDDKLRYIDRDGCYILFINACSIYPGFSQQTSAVKHAPAQFRDLLENNALALTTSQILKKDLFQAIPIWVVVAIDIGNEIFLMEIRKFEHDGPVFAVMLKQLTAFDSYRGGR